MATVKLQGKPLQTIGEPPSPGTRAPDFKLVGADLAEVRLQDYSGKRKLLNIVPSLDTPVCANSTRQFNQQAASLEDTVVLVISADLPFAQKRFCSTEGIDRVVALSMMRDKNFGKEYGTLITDGPLAGLNARAVVVLDENDRVLHSELVPEISQEPDYDKALAALKR